MAELVAAKTVNTCKLCGRLTATGYYLRVKQVMPHPDREGRFLGDKDNSRHLLYGFYPKGFPRYVVDENNEFCDGHSLEEIAESIRTLMPPNPPLTQTRILYNPGSKLTEKMGFLGRRGIDQNRTLRGAIVPSVDQILPAIRALMSNEEQL